MNVFASRSASASAARASFQFASRRRQSQRFRPNLEICEPKALLSFMITNSGNGTGSFVYETNLALQAGGAQTIYVDTSITLTQNYTAQVPAGAGLTYISSPHGNTITEPTGTGLTFQTPLGSSYGSVSLESLNFATTGSGVTGVTFSGTMDGTVNYATASGFSEFVNVQNTALVSVYNCTITPTGVGIEIGVASSANCSNDAFKGGAIAISNGGNLWETGGVFTGDKDGIEDSTTAGILYVDTSTFNGELGNGNRWYQGCDIDDLTYKNAASVDIQSSIFENTPTSAGCYTVSIDTTWNQQIQFLSNDLVSNNKGGLYIQGDGIDTLVENNGFLNSTSTADETLIDGGAAEFIGNQWSGNSNTGSVPLAFSVSAGTDGTIYPPADIVVAYCTIISNTIYGASGSIDFYEESSSSGAGTAAYLAFCLVADNDVIGGNGGGPDFIISGTSGNAPIASIQFSTITGNSATPSGGSGGLGGGFELDDPGLRNFQMEVDSSIVAGDSGGQYPEGYVILAAGSTAAPISSDGWNCTTSTLVSTSIPVSGWEPTDVIASVSQLDLAAPSHDTRNPFVAYSILVTSTSSKAWGHGDPGEQGADDQLQEIENGPYTTGAAGEIWSSMYDGGTVSESPSAMALLVSIRGVHSAVPAVVSSAGMQSGLRATPVLSEPPVVSQATTVIPIILSPPYLTGQDQETVTPIILSPPPLPGQGQTTVIPIIQSPPPLTVPGGMGMVHPVVASIDDILGNYKGGSSLLNS